MPRPRRLGRPADPPQRLPAALRVRPLQPKALCHPGGDLGAAPHAAILGRRPHPRGQGGEHGLRQKAGGLAVAPPPVAQRRGAGGVVARRQLRHPARHEGQHLRDLQHGAPLRQQPDRLEVPRLGHVPRGPVARLQLLDGEMPSDPRHGAAPEPRPASLRRSVAHRNPPAQGGDLPDSVSHARRGGSGQDGQPAPPPQQASSSSSSAGSSSAGMRDRSASAS